MYIWPDGKKHVGEFRDDLPNGQGTYTYPDGAMYAGEYKHGERHGQGRMSSLAQDFGVRDSYPPRSGAICLNDISRFPKQLSEGFWHLSGNQLLWKHESSTSYMTMI